MHDTLATMITSRRSKRARVALCRRRSISSLRDESFSMYVSDEILDRVVGEELAELLVELRRQRLVVRHHQRRALGSLDHLGGREGLACAGGTQQHLVMEPT